MIKAIGLITPGGDAPGMNTAIRAVVRSAIYHGIRVVGIERGYLGLIEGDLHEMDLRSVGGIINKGGTILHTVRCEKFKDKKIREKAIENLKNWKIEGLILIGGDGSLRGARDLARESHIPCVVIPATIDNDIPCTDCTIGFDTAVNTAVEAIDKIRDTATSHERAFVVEVMGRKNGFIALEVGLVCGVEATLIPEVKFNLDKICKRLIEGRNRGKTSTIIVLAEGAAHAHEVAEQISQKTKMEVRISILGHVQRGGSPSALSRWLASCFGEYAVNLLREGKKNRMVGIAGHKVISTEIEQVLKNKKTVEIDKYKLAEILSI